MNISKISVKLHFSSLSLSLSLSVLLLLGIFSFNNLEADSGTTIKLDYVAGMDSGGSETKTLGHSAGAEASLIKDNYLFVRAYNLTSTTTSCSQVAGSAQGCELQVYDISNPENPVYVAGRDSSGNATGTSNVSIRTQAIKGNYLYTGSEGSGSACSQVEGSAEGCELQVYDISNPANPVYVAGRDVSGNATGTANVAINTLVIKGDYLFVGKNGNSAACSQTAGSAIGCELMVYDISSSTNPVFIAGRDADGSAIGTGISLIYSLVTRGDYLFVGKTGSNTNACSQTAGTIGASHCELQVYDISNPANPTYVAGRDVDGSENGTVHGQIISIFAKDNYLFVGTYDNSTACSQAAGFAQGCELQVYDISSSTNPIYVAGRDADGSGSGTKTGGVYSLFSSGDYLFVGTGDDSYYEDGLPFCLETIGAAEGCELKIYDISDSTNPTFVSGRDSDGSNNGTSDNFIVSFIMKDNYLFVGTGGGPGTDSTTTCSSTPGSALGCELQVYSFATFLNHSTSFTISQEINEELSLSLINPITLSTLPGLSGGTTVASTTFNIKTNSHSGYSATLNFSTATSLQRIEGEGYLNNYLPQSSTTPDYTFNPPTTSHSFAYNLTSTSTDDLTPLFKHNGTTCNTGTNSTPTNCWYNQANATIPLTLINRPTATTYHGIDYTLTFRVDVAPNPSPSLPEGVYQATATITVLPN